MTSRAPGGSRATHAALMLAAVVALAGAIAGCARPLTAVESHAVVAPLDLAGLARDFDGRAGQARVIALFSPT